MRFRSNHSIRARFRLLSLAPKAVQSDLECEEHFCPILSDSTSTYLYVALPPLSLSLMTYQKDALQGLPVLGSKDNLITAISVV